jgi:hypothetical protein
MPACRAFSYDLILESYVFSLWSLLHIFFHEFFHVELYVLVLTDHHQVHLMCYRQSIALSMQIPILILILLPNS